MTVKLNGKDYVTVSERVEAALGADERYQMIGAETFSLNDRWFYRVTVLVGERQYIGTAEVKFNAPQSSADGKNPIECAETSALGRALGFAGFGVVDGIASADELMRSEERRQPQQQPTPQPAKPAKAPQAVNELAGKRAPGDEQMLLADKLRDAGMKTVGDVKAFSRDHIGREIDGAALGMGRSDITMGETSKLLLELNKLANARQSA